MDGPGARLTLASLEKPTTVPYLGIERADAWTIAGPVPAGYLLGSLSGSQLLAGALAVLGGLVGAAIVYAAPSYLDSQQWLRTLWYVLTRSRTVDNVDDPDRQAAERPPPFDRFVADERTRDVTNVERYYPGRGVIERTDGRMAAAMALDPPSMDFAEPDDWERITDACARFANNALDFELQLYATTREFPIEDHVADLEERLEDDDVADNPVLAAVVEEMVETRPEQVDDAGTAPVHYYCIVDVGPGEVVSDNEDESAIGKLAKVPLLGIPVSVLASYQQSLTEQRRRARMFRKLDERLRAVDRGLVREIPGYSGRRLPLAEWLPLVEEAWCGTEPEYGDPDAVPRRSPATTAPPGEAAVGPDPDDRDGPATDGRTEPNAAGGECDETTRNGDEEGSDTAETPGLLRSVLAGLPVVRRVVTAGELSDAEDQGDEHGDGMPEDASDGGDGMDRDEEGGSRDEPSSSNGSGDCGDTGVIDDLRRADVATAPADGGDTDEREEIAEVDERQRRQLAPSGIERGYRHLSVGDRRRRVLFVDSWPDAVEHGALRRLFTQPDLHFDLSMHVSPRDRDRARSAAERRARSLEADAETGAGDFAAGDKRDRARRTAAVRDLIDDGQRPFDVSTYVATYGDDGDELREETRRIRAVFQDAPANATVKTLAGKQVRGFESVAPVGDDALADAPELDTQRLVLGRGLGALLGSCSRSQLLESGGVEMGEHAFNGSPIVKDPFESETNYNWVVVGDSGSGKSYQSKQMALRTAIAQENTKLIVLDPLQGFGGLSRALDAERITIGGDRGLNPLEIRAPTDGDEERDLDPLSEKLRDVMSFFDNFANEQGLSLGAARPVLSSAVAEAYRRAGITHDVATHDRESPTIRDVLDVLEDMTADPGEFVVRTDAEAESIRGHATELLGYLRPFVDGQYENLARASEFDLRGEDVVYLDLSQQENSASGGGLTMQLVFSLVYERAKETPDNVVFLIDEARFLMRDAKNLAFLGQRVRHSRHYDTSIRFITQNVRDFFDHEEAESIVNNSFVKLLHRTEEIGEWADTFGLNDGQVEFVHGAATGDDGYSEALAEIDGTWYPLQIFATEREHAVIDFDEREGARADLPGMGGDGAPTTGDVESRLVDRGDTADDELAEAWADLSPAHREYAGLLTGPELADALEAIAAGTDPTAAIAGAVAAKFRRLLGDGDEERIADRLAAREGSLSRADGDREGPSEWSGSAFEPATDD